jgi:hypothetical protein
LALMRFEGEMHRQADAAHRRGLQAVQCDGISRIDDDRPALLFKEHAEWVDIRR